VVQERKGWQEDCAAWSKNLAAGITPAEYVTRMIEKEILVPVEWNEQTISWEEV